MISSALTAFLTSLATFVVLVLVTQQERQRGRRFFAAGVRGWLDAKVDQAGKGIFGGFDHFMKYIVQLNWYYSIHSVLRTLLRGLVAIYTYFENMFERNRKRTKDLRAEKRQLSELSHLQQVAKHKEETALTPAQQQRLRKKQLEGKG